MKKLKYIYILSQRYSGSTLLSFLLATHPSISTIGERRKFFNHSLMAKGTNGQVCSCGKLFSQCEHWNAIKKGFLSKAKTARFSTNITEFRLFNNKYLDRLTYESVKFLALHDIPKSYWPFLKRIQKLNHLNLLLVKEILAVDGGSVFLDSSKSANQLVFLSMMEEIDLRIIWLSRDPKAQVYSAMKYNPWTVEQAAKYWKEEVLLNQKILDGLGLNYTRLSYEKLCHQQEEELSRVLGFAGLSADEFSLDFRSQKLHVMGNYSMRTGSDTTIKERKDWQEHLSAEDISQIEAIVGDV